jgi:hypothetical protein
VKHDLSSVAAAWCRAASLLGCLVLQPHHRGQCLDLLGIARDGIEQQRSMPAMLASINRMSPGWSVRGLFHSEVLEQWQKTGTVREGDES